MQGFCVFTKISQKTMSCKTGIASETIGKGIF